MILFMSRLGDLRENALKYIRSKMEEVAEPIQLSEITRLEKSPEGHIWISHLSDGKWEVRPLEVITIEGLCITADALHTLPIKDLKT